MDNKSNITPKMVQMTSKGYHAEFDEYYAGLLIEDSTANEELAFRSFMCHKMAVMDLTLKHILETAHYHEGFNPKE